MESRFYSLNQYCRKTFGEKTYRLSLNANMTCPNRDGTLSYNGCSFCSAGGSGDFAASPCATIQEQFEVAKKRIAAKTDCHSFIAYLQAFTNTYAPVDRLRSIYTDAMSPSDVVALSIGTRCDCVSDEVITLLSELNHIKPVWVELGLQTIHNSTHKKLNTFTTLELFYDAYSRLTAVQIPVVIHIILGLPGETREQMLATVDYVAHLHPFGVKLQLLHVLKETALASTYNSQPFPIMEMPEYIDLVGECVEHLPKDTVIHRLTGDGPKKLLIAPLWSADKKNVLNTLNRRFEELDIRQGKQFKE